MAGLGSRKTLVAPVRSTGEAGWGNCPEWIPLHDELRLFPLTFAARDERENQSQQPA